MDGLALTPGALAETLSLIDEGVISGKIAKDVLPRLLEGEGNSGVRAFVEAQGLVQISGERGAHAHFCLHHAKALRCVCFVSDVELIHHHQCMDHAACWCARLPLSMLHARMLSCSRFFWSRRSACLRSPQ